MNAYPHRATHSQSSSPPRMNPWNWVLLVVGVLLTGLGLTLTMSAAVVLGAAATQDDGQYLTTDTERLQSTGHAIVGPPLVLDLGPSPTPGMPSLAEIASFQVRATPVISDQALFVGIADASEVAAYLDDVPHAALGGKSWTPDTGLSGQWSWPSDHDDGLQEIGGAQPPDSPTEQDFWVESATGTGTQELTFDLQEGDWSLVVMNADGSQPVWVDLQAGGRTELLDPIGPGLLIAGLIALVIGIPLLLLGAAGLGRNIDQRHPPHDSFTASGPGDSAVSGGGVVAYPLSLVGYLDGQLSRGLWLVKWLLAIPHYIVLALLWFAVLVTTIAAGIAILFTARYPRSWFAFSVGVLRWNWRVGFYAYLALGTDRYPPFTLAHANYPADLAVLYPERLSRGLVLVKWWLLAIPHLLIVGILTGSGGVVGIGAIRENTGWGLSLLGLLVLIAAIALLFTGRYLPGLFILIVGLNRWVYRVSTYVMLLRDEYPPFRLDQGPVEPPAQLEADQPPV